MSSEQVEIKKEPKKNSQLSILNSQLENDNSQLDNIRSDEVQEILSHVPNWMIRWGISLIFVLIAMLVFISWFIKYPDVIEGKIMLTTKIPPIKLVTKNSGQLQKIYANEGDLVSEGDFIAELENPLNDSSIHYLQTLISDVEKGLISKKPQALKNISFKNSQWVFGDMQSEFNSLKSLVKEYGVFKTNPFNEEKIKHLKKQIEYHERLATISNRQFTAFEKNLQNAKQKYESDKQLYEKGIISKMEFYARETEWIQSQQEVENLKKAYVQNKITIAEYKKQKQELNYEFSEKERTLKERIHSAVNNLKNYILSWEQNYVLTAPFSGKLSYISQVYQNQFIKAGTALFAVVPDNNKYIGYIEIPAQGFGKVKPNQMVHIKLDHYPYHEYGQVNAKVVEVTQMPNNKGNHHIYLAKVELTNNLTSTYQKELEFKPEMSGTAEIVTEDLRLMERIFNQIRKVITN
jgi:multidrug resistance efflux pump